MALLLGKKDSSAFVRAHLKLDVLVLQSLHIEPIGEMQWIKKNHFQTVSRKKTGRRAGDSCKYLKLQGFGRRVSSLPSNVVSIISTA